MSKAASEKRSKLFTQHKADCEFFLPNYYCSSKHCCVFHDECVDCKEYKIKIVKE